MIDPEKLTAEEEIKTIFHALQTISKEDAIKELPIAMQDALEVIEQNRIETAKQIFEELENFFRKDDNQGFYIKRLFLRGHFLSDRYEKFKSKFIATEQEKPK